MSRQFFLHGRPAVHLFLYLIVVITSDVECQLWNSSWCIFLQSHVINPLKIIKTTWRFTSRQGRTESSATPLWESQISKQDKLNTEATVHGGTQTYVRTQKGMSRFCMHHVRIRVSCQGFRSGVHKCICQEFISGVYKCICQEFISGVYKCICQGFISGVYKCICQEFISGMHKCICQ